MRAYLSYSLNDNEQYVIPLLAQKLQEQGFYVTNGSYYQGEEISYQVKNEIKSSNLLIGLITVTGTSNQKVYNEWLFGTSNKVPSVLFVEDTYNLHPDLQNHSNIIRFNRNSPAMAINTIQFNLKKSVQSKSTNSISEAAPWVLGGLALVALIRLLAKE